MQKFSGCRATSGIHVKRTSGMAIFYDESIYGVPHAMVELVRVLCVYQTNISLTCISHVLTVGRCNHST